MAFRIPRDAGLVRFPAADGVDLEGRLTVRGRQRGVVLCHPHPLYGGSMLAPVVLTAEEAFQAAGYSTLAFNFRGVGGSRGQHGGGVAEEGDVAGALAYLQSRLGGLDPPGEPGGARIGLAGYSFGSVVAGRLAARVPVFLYVAIAPPLDLYDFDWLVTTSSRVALVAGDRDEFCAPPRLGALRRALPGPTWLRSLPADHFFGGALPALAAACRDAIAWAEAGA